MIAAIRPVVVLLIVAAICVPALADAQHDAYNKFQRGERLSDSDVDALANRPLPPSNSSPAGTFFVGAVIVLLLVGFWVAVVVGIVKGFQRQQRLTKCPDCRRQISREATMCPSCGKPIANG